MSVQWYYKRLLRGYNNTHVLQTRNRKLYVTRELTEEKDGKESTRVARLRQFTTKGQ